MQVHDASGVHTVRYCAARQRHANPALAHSQPKHAHFDAQETHTWQPSSNAHSHSAHTHAEPSGPTYPGLRSPAQWHQHRGQDTKQGSSAVRSCATSSSGPAPLQCSAHPHCAGLCVATPRAFPLKHARTQERTHTGTAITCLCPQSPSAQTPAAALAGQPLSHAAAAAAAEMVRLLTAPKQHPTATCRLAGHTYHG